MNQMSTSVRRGYRVLRAFVYYIFPSTAPPVLCGFLWGHLQMFFRLVLPSMYRGAVLSLTLRSDYINLGKQWGIGAVKGLIVTYYLVSPFSQSKFKYSKKKTIYLIVSNGIQRKFMQEDTKYHLGIKGTKL